MQKLHRSLTVTSAIFAALAVAAILVADFAGHASSSVSQLLDWSAREAAALEHTLQAKVTPRGDLVPGIRW